MMKLLISMLMVILVSGKWIVSHSIIMNMN